MSFRNFQRLAALPTGQALNPEEAGAECACCRLATHLAVVEDLAPEANEPRCRVLLATHVFQNLAAILRVHLPKARREFRTVQGRNDVAFMVAQGRAWRASQALWDRSAAPGLTRRPDA